MNVPRRDQRRWPPPDKQAGLRPRPRATHRGISRRSEAGWMTWWKWRVGRAVAEVFALEIEAAIGVSLPSWIIVLACLRDGVLVLPGEGTITPKDRNTSVSSLGQGSVFFFFHTQGRATDISREISNFFEATYCGERCRERNGQRSQTIFNGPRPPDPHNAALQPPLPQTATATRPDVAGHSALARHATALRWS